MNFVVQLLRDDRIESRTVVNEKDARISVRIIQVLHHKMQVMVVPIISCCISSNRSHVVMCTRYVYVTCCSRESIGCREYVTQCMLGEKETCRGVDFTDWLYGKRRHLNVPFLSRSCPSCIPVSRAANKALQMLLLWCIFIFGVKVIRYRFLVIYQFVYFR